MQTGTKDIKGDRGRSAAGRGPFVYPRPFPIERASDLHIAENRIVARELSLCTGMDRP